MNQCVEWLTRPDPEYGVPYIDWLISVFTGNKNDYGNPDPSINSWAHPVGTLKDLLKNRCNLKGVLVLCPYLCPNGLKTFLVVSHIKGGIIIRE